MTDFEKDLQNINVKLLYVSPEYVLWHAARISHGGDFKYHTEEENRKLITQLIHMGHHSVLEHMVYSFEVNGITRAVLQELVRHRIASYTVSSTRFTLKKVLSKGVSVAELDKYFRIYNDKQYKATMQTIDYMADVLEENPKIRNDELKYYLPENYRVDRLVFTVNLRTLLNFLHLRLSKRALGEIRALATKIYEIQKVNPTPNTYYEEYEKYLNCNK